jgi:hypothetical protein
MPASLGPSPRSPAAKILELFGLWGLALALSALLVAAGQRWSAPLPIRGDLILVLLLTPALAVLAWLLGRWRLDPPSQEPPDALGADRRDGESSGVERESV